MKKQKENSHEGITWSEMGKQNVQAEKVYLKKKTRLQTFFFRRVRPLLFNFGTFALRGWDVKKRLQFKDGAY